MDSCPNARGVDPAIGAQRFVDRFERDVGGEGNVVHLANPTDHVDLPRRLAIADDVRLTIRKPQKIVGDRGEDERGEIVDVDARGEVGAVAGMRCSPRTMRRCRPRSAP